VYKKSRMNDAEVFTLALVQRASEIYYEACIIFSRCDHLIFADFIDRVSSRSNLFFRYMINIEYNRLTHMLSAKWSISDFALIYFVL